MAYGINGSVGGSAAAGISAGFQMGREISNDQDRQQQLARENARQDVLDAQRADQLARNNKRQDVADADTQQDRGIAAVSAEMEDNRYQLAALAQQYGGADKIPQSVVNPLIAQANDIVQRRTTLLNQKYAPVVQAEQQWAQNMASRWQAGQIQPQDFKPGEFTRMVQALTGRSVNDFVRPTDPKTGAITGNSVVGQGIADVQAGLPSGNGGLVAQGTNALLGNEVQQGVGQVAPDGSIITGKAISALVPAPAPLTTPPAAPVAPLTGLSAGLSAATTPAQSFPVSPTGPPTAGGLSGAQADASTLPGNGMGGAPDTPAAATPGQPQPAAAPPPTPMQALTAPSLQPPAPPPPPPPPPPPLAPGTDPNRVIPVLQVTAQHPDGTTVQYHAPMTQNRSTDPNDPLHPGFQISDAMQRMGQLGTLEAFINTPGAQQMIASDKAALGPGVNDFPSAYAAMHGDPKALLPVGSTDPTTQKIAAINKFMNDYNADPKNAGAPITFAQAVQQVEGKPMGPTTGIAAQLAQVHDQAVKDGLSDEAEAKKLQGMGVLRTPPVGPSTADTGGTLTGDALLQTLAPNDQALVKGLIDGSIKPETISTRNNQRQTLVGIAARVAAGTGGSMNTSTAAVNQATEKAFTTGTPSRTIRAMNTAVDHLNTLGQLATALNNSDVNAINALKNKAASQFGDVDITNFDAAKQIVADEVVKAVVASGGSIGGALADREKAEAQVNNAKSPQQLAGVINTFTKLMGGQINSLGQQYVSGGGTRDFTSFLTPATRGLYHGPQPKGVSGGGGATGSSTGGFVNGKVYQDAKGNKATYNNGAWTPVQ